MLVSSKLDIGCYIVWFTLLFLEEFAIWKWPIPHLQKIFSLYNSHNIKTHKIYRYIVPFIKFVYCMWIE